jgi:hypothetical protein
MFLAKSRSMHDDRIIQSINQLPNTSDYVELAKRQRKIQAQRVCDIHFCIQVLQMESDKLGSDNGDKAQMLGKEIGLLKSELVVESIMRDRTEEVISTRCVPL